MLDKLVPVCQLAVGTDKDNNNRNEGAIPQGISTPICLQNLGFLNLKPSDYCRTPVILADDAPLLRLPPLKKPGPGIA
jgi:hypothetical protein